MLVFFDESGDTGFKIGHGSSALFTVAMVVFEEHDEAQATDDRIALLRRELHKDADFEFHFVENSNATRQAFFEAVSRYNFFFFGFVINKARFQGTEFSSKGAFYRYVCGLIFENAKPYLDNAIVKLDGCGNREFRQELTTYLKRKINDPDQERRYIKKVVTPKSSGNNLIQLADMICGAINRAQLGEKKDAAQFYRLIRHREIWVRQWPED